MSRSSRHGLIDSQGNSKLPFPGWGQLAPTSRGPLSRGRAIPAPRLTGSRPELDAAPIDFWRRTKAIPPQSRSVLPCHRQVTLDRRTNENRSDEDY